MLYVCEVSPAHCVAVPVIVPGVAGVAEIVAVTSSLDVLSQPAGFWEA